MSVLCKMVTLQVFIQEYAISEGFLYEIFFWNSVSLVDSCMIVYFLPFSCMKYAISLDCGCWFRTRKLLNYGVLV